MAGKEESHRDNRRNHFRRNPTTIKPTRIDRSRTHYGRCGLGKAEWTHGGPAKKRIETARTQRQFILDFLLDHPLPPPNSDQGEENKV